MKPLLTSLLPKGGDRKPNKAIKPTERKTDVWFHATEAAHIPAFLQLRRSISVERPNLTSLITTDGSVKRPDGLDPTVAWYELTSDKASDAHAFLTAFAPQLCLWAGGWLKPTLIAEADKGGVPLFLLDAVADGLQSSLWRGRGVFERRALRSFSAILARDAAAALALSKLGVENSDILVAGRMQQGIPALPGNEDDLQNLTRAIHNRPVWLAACVRASEVDIVLNAHIEASRTAHRLLLLLVPDDEDEAEAFKQSLSKHNLRFSIWPDLGGLADETSQVLLAEDPFEMGLWLRASPICFLGCSLKAGLGGRNPFAAANLGSAVLYGPNVGQYLESYSRFAAAGGARIVRDVETLSAAVKQLSAPDRAAQMAMAAWELATEGAEVTDRITNLVHDALDHLGVD